MTPDELMQLQRRAALLSAAAATLTIIWIAPQLLKRLTK